VIVVVAGTGMTAGAGLGMIAAVVIEPAARLLVAAGLRMASGLRAVMLRARQGVYYVQNVVHALVEAVVGRVNIGRKRDSGG
jgi:ureidoglycolate hydrolase